MRSFWQGLARFAMLRAIIYIVLGLLVVIWPEPVLSFLMYVIAAYLVLMGILGIIGYIRNHAEGGALRLVVGILLVVLGVVVFAFVHTILTIITVFLGILLAIGGIFLFALALNAKQFTGKVSVLSIIISIVVVALGVLVVVNPFGARAVAMIVFGIALILMGIGELIAFFSYRKAGKDLTQ